MPIKVHIPSSKDKIKQQIQALKIQIERDKNDKDKQIHEYALKELEKALESL